MPLAEDGSYTPDPVLRNHPYMPREPLLRKLARIAIAGSVVAHEVEVGKRGSERMARALAAFVHWSNDVEVTAWIQDLKDRGDIEPEFLK